MMNVTAIVPAAGAGTRLGADKPKALVELAGEPLIVHAVRGLRSAGVQQIIVTAPDDSAVQQGFSSSFALAHIDDVVIISGGHTRQESVACGLAAVRASWPETSHVLIHDAARSLTPPAMIRRVLNMLVAGAPAVIPVLPVVDTIKKIVTTTDVDPYTDLVERTMDRNLLRAVQTPQGFQMELIERAHQLSARMNAQEQTAAPDDAALVELMGEPVRTVPGDRRAFKITTPFDLELAQWLMERASSSTKLA